MEKLNSKAMHKFSFWYPGKSVFSTFFTNFPPRLWVPLCPAPSLLPPSPGDGCPGVRQWGGTRHLQGPQTPRARLLGGHRPLHTPMPVVGPRDTGKVSPKAALGSIGVLRSPKRQGQLGMGWSTCTARALGQNAGRQGGANRTGMVRGCTMVCGGCARGRRGRGADRTSHLLLAAGHAPGETQQPWREGGHLPAHEHHCCPCGHPPHPPSVATQSLWGASRVSAEPSGHRSHWQGAVGWCREHLQGFLPLTEHPGIREWWALRGRQPEGWAMHMNALGAQRAPVPAASPFTTCVAALPLPTQGLTNTWAPPQLSTESKIYWLFTADFTFNFLLSHSHQVYVPTQF